MRFTLSSSVLSNRLGILSKVINTKNSLSILDSIHFDIRDGQLTLTGSDNSVMMRCYISLNECDGEASFCITNHTFIAAVKELAEQPLTFEVDTTDNSIRMVYQNGAYQLVGQSSEEYPLMAGVEGECTEFHIEAGILATNIQRSVFATGNDELRMVMNGLFFDLTEDSLNIVATDGHKLARNMIFSCKSSTPASFILPKKPSNLLRTVLASDDENQVTIRFNSTSAEIVYPDGIICCRLIEGRYPNYMSVIPTNNPNIVNIDRRALIGALRRVMPFASEATELIKYKMDINNMELEAEDIDFAKSAHEDVICEYSASPLQIGFKGTIMAEILNNLTSDEVTIELGDASRPGVIRPSVQPEGQDVLMLIMPMTLGNM